MSLAPMINEDEDSVQSLKHNSNLELDGEFGFDENHEENITPEVKNEDSETSSLTQEIGKKKKNIRSTETTPKQIVEELKKVCSKYII